MTLSVLFLLLLAAGSLFAMMQGRQLVLGTTLVGPWAWTLTSLAVLSGVLLFIASGQRSFSNEASDWELALMFAAVTSSFCPLMSILGAKRPQDRGWHFVVIALWAILILPVAESFVLRHGQMPDMHGARSWFMLLLIGLGIANSLPTRLWFPAMLFGTGQLLMLGNTLPMIRDIVDSPPVVAGFSCCALASIIAVQFGKRLKRPVNSPDAVWLNFRDAFGLLWGLRVAEQINITAQTAEWPFRLRWRGFVDEQGVPVKWQSLSSETRQALDQVMQNLLRRFVSADWISVKEEEQVH